MEEQTCWGPADVLGVPLATPSATAFPTRMPTVLSLVGPLIGGVRFWFLRCCYWSWMFLVGSPLVCALLMLPFFHENDGRRSALIKRMCSAVSVVITVLEAVAARCALPALFYLCEVTEDGSVLAGVELELPADRGGAVPRRAFFWSVVSHECLAAYDKAAIQAIRFCRVYTVLLSETIITTVPFVPPSSCLCVHGVAGFPIGDGFFPIVSAEVATRNRKRRKVIHDRQRGRILDAPFTSPLEPSWVGFTAEEVAILKAGYADKSYYGGPDYRCSRCKASFWYQERVKGASAITERRVVYNNCCKGGKVFIAPFKEPPEFLRALLDFDGPVTAAAFAQWVLSIGDGTLPAVARQGESDPTWITIPNEHLVHTDGDKIGAIVDAVYVDFLKRYSDPNYLRERAILTPTNEVAEDVNRHVLSMVPGEEKEYLSCDSTGNSADGIRNIDIFYPVEVLNTVKMAFNLLSEIHMDSHQWTICVLVSRLWNYHGGTDEGAIQHTDMVLLDTEIPPATSERLKDVLAEGKVFVIRKFFCNPSKPAFRPVESPFMVQFTKYTTVEERPGLADTYPFCTYSLTSFADIPVPCGRPERFIDVIGKIEMVSDVIPVQSLYQATASNTRTVILKDLLGNEIRLVLWGDRALEFDAESVRAMGDKELVIAIFVGTLPKSSHGVIGLSGSSAYRWYIDEDIPDINLFRERLGTKFVPLAAYVPIGPGAIVPRVYEPPVEKTLKDLNEVDPFVDMEKNFLCTATVNRLDNDQRWWFASCSVCRKSSKHDGYRFQCSGKDWAIGKQLMNLMRQRYPGQYTVDELANAARHDTAIPAEIERLIGQKYKLLVSISKKWNSGNSENLHFQVCRIEETYKPELPPLASAASSSSAGASSSVGGSGSRLLPFNPVLSPQRTAPAFGRSHNWPGFHGGSAMPPSPIASPGTPARGSSTPMCGVRRSLFSSPVKQNEDLATDDAAAAEEEAPTLVEPVESDVPTADVEKNGLPPNQEPKRNANSAKAGALPKKAKP
ncbi:hypothetical protein ACQ4PT_065142 [Festuca glaucescens]